MFIVAQVMSSGESLSIIGRSKVGLDLDCYELICLIIDKPCPIVRRLHVLENEISSFSDGYIP